VVHGDSHDPHGLLEMAALNLPKGLSRKEETASLKRTVGAMGDKLVRGNEPAHCGGLE